MTSVSDNAVNISVNSYDDDYTSMFHGTLIKPCRSVTRCLLGSLLYHDWSLLLLLLLSEAVLPLLLLFWLEEGICIDDDVPPMIFNEDTSSMKLLVLICIGAKLCDDRKA